MDYYNALINKDISINRIDEDWGKFLYDRYGNDYDKWEWWDALKMFLRKEVSAHTELVNKSEVLDDIYKHDGSHAILNTINNLKTYEKK